MAFLSRALSLAAFLLVIAADPSSADSHSSVLNVPLGVRVGGPGASLMSGVSVGYGVGNFAWLLVPEGSFQPAYNSSEKFLTIWGARVGAEGRYFVPSKSKWWVGVGGGVWYYYAPKLFDEKKVSFIGQFGKVAIGSSPWGKNGTVGPVMSMSMGPLERAWGETFSAGSMLEANIEITLGAEWRIH